MKIVVSGRAVAYKIDTEEEITDPAKLKRLDGLLFDKFDYSDNIPPDLEVLGVQGGQVRMRFDKKKKELRVTTEFVSPKKLPTKQLNQLIDLATGDWSDGTGEGEFQYRKKLKMDIDLSPEGKTNVKVEQIDDGKKIPVPKANELTAAIDANDIPKIKKLLALGADPNVADRRGITPLHTACGRLNVELVLLLLEHGANVNAKDKESSTPLSYLAPKDPLEVDAKLLITIADALLKRRAIVDGFDKSGMTPLMWAANRNHHAMIKWLIKNGANANAKSKTKYNENRVLMFTQDVKTIKLLLQLGADPWLCDDMGNNAYEHIKDQRDSAVEMESRFGREEDVSEYKAPMKFLQEFMKIKK